MSAPSIVIDPTLYPFASRFHHTPEGRLHYVDEGSGPVVVLVHGTPTWSFLYRDLIARLARHYRVIAVDHLGFGLSDKPPAADYRPQAHARRLEDLIVRLDVRDLTLVVHDFGGPIGLSFALEHPDRVSRLVLLNTWLWSLAGDRSTVRISRMLGSRFGRLLYTRLNFSPRALLKLAFADRSRLTPAVHRHYMTVFPTRHERMAPWVFARELIGSSAWYERLWSKRERLHGRPVLIAWGMKDPAFTPAFLARWRAELPDAEVMELPDAGHFVTEEAGDEVAGAIERFLGAAVHAAATHGGTRP